MRLSLLLLVVRFTDGLHVHLGGRIGMLLVGMQGGPSMTRLQIRWLSVEKRLECSRCMWCVMLSEVVPLVVSVSVLLDRLILLIR